MVQLALHLGKVLFDFPSNLDLCHRAPDLVMGRLGQSNVTTNLPKRENFERSVQVQRRSAVSIRLGQAVFCVHSRSSLINVFASSMSLRMIVVSATFGGLPFVIMSWYLARISGLCLAATRAGM